jgi:hypothetical protein
MSLGPGFLHVPMRNKIKQRVPALVLSLWILTVKLSSECRYAECRSAKNRGANLEVSFVKRGRARIK